MMLLVPAAHANTDAETRLTAVFLGRFASYVDWPPAERAHFVITVLGDNPFGALLDELYRNKHIQGKPVELHYAQTLKQIGPTDILFINLHSASGRLAAIQFAHQHGALSISESRGFADSGGIIQLNVVEQKPQIKINYAAAVASGLKIGSPLLSIATVLRKDQP
ncbi:YfiR family protein [Thiopseudomonas denitrificans]|uniref:Uncharacterized protein DUF4154 n=1 Tax=Thiopseudomonas denitrificans TaxID=1501432 RepID=A0A4R6TXG7_9GAMM|nr:YfiR family protein [Thiopseudomonas denitrificans]TDQ38231.1 uncharacterized protein DUF4154 [Thiopseudomonas denitrificans]